MASAVGRSAGSFRRSLSQQATTGAAFAAVAALGFLVTVRVGERPIVLALLAAAAVLAGALLFFSERYVISLAILMGYVGLLDGFLKLKYGGTTITVARDLLLYIVAAGALVRLAVTGRPIDLPPLTALIVAWCAIVAVQIFNPDHGTTSHSIQALRQHIEWVPLFFLGYSVMRSVSRIRAFFMLLLVITTINGAVAVYQYEAGPDAVAGWGPGYSAYIYGSDTVSGRTFTSTAGGGDKHLRPFGLGSDVGFGGGLAILGAPAAFALIALTRRRRAQLVGVGLAGGVAIAAVSSETRVDILGVVLAVGAVIGLSVASRRAAGAMAAALVLAVIVYIAASSLGGTADFFGRYASISGGSAVTTSVDYKRGTLAILPYFISHHPFGAGLGVVGPASSVAGAPAGSTRISGESELNFLFAEVGIPGFLLLLAFCVSVVAASTARIRRQPDPELRILLAALCAPLIAMLVLWLGAPVTSSSPLAPYLWFASGVLAYWCLGTGQGGAGRDVVRRVLV